MKTFYNVANIIVAIEGNDVYANELRKYFEKERVETVSCGEDFLIQVNNNDKKNKELDYYSLSGKISFDENEYRVKKQHYVYSVKDLFAEKKKTVLSINWMRKDSFINAVKNHMLPKSIGIYTNAEKFVDMIMNYEVFWYIFAVVLMKKQKVFVHCGLVAQNNQAVVMAGTGGCGKTSTLLEYLNHTNCEYVAEDFGILGADGNAQFTPKKVAIYQSDARYKNENILKSLEKLSPIEKGFWNLFKAIGKNPRYRFSPYEVFKYAGINKRVQIKKVVYLSRKNVDTIIEKEIEKTQLIEKMMNASFRELKELYEVLSNIRAVGDAKVRGHYPALETLQEQYKNILSEALNNVEIGLLELPLKVAPSETVEKIYID